MTNLDEALSAAGRFLTEPHVQVVRPGDGDHDGPEDSPRAAAILGKRADDIPADVSGVIPFDQPVELGYHCPVCVYANVVDGEFDERLTWSEYRAMLWCYVCERDYPSALCLTDPVRATEVFLDSLAEAVARRAAELQDRAAPWAHELAEVERVIEEKRGERAAEAVGAPLHEIVWHLVDEAHAAGREVGGWQASDAITPEVLARALRPTADDPADPLTHAGLVRARLADELGWPA